MSKPKRPYEIVISAGADSLEDLATTLEIIAQDICGEKAVIKLSRTSGSPSSGYNFEIVRTDTADHDEYFEKLEKYLTEKREEPNE